MNKMSNIVRKDDEYETPLYAVKVIESYLKPGSTIWCPFDKEWSAYVQSFLRGGVSGSQKSYR